jgi:hypothetical protein
MAIGPKILRGLKYHRIGASPAARQRAVQLYPGLAPLLAQEQDHHRVAAVEAGGLGQRAVQVWRTADITREPWSAGDELFPAGNRTPGWHPPRPGARAPTKQPDLNPKFALCNYCKAESFESLRSKVLSGSVHVALHRGAAL